MRTYRCEAQFNEPRVESDFPYLFVVDHEADSDHGTRRFPVILHALNLARPIRKWRTAASNDCPMRRTAHGPAKSEQRTRPISRSVNTPHLFNIYVEP